MLGWALSVFLLGCTAVAVAAGARWARTVATRQPAAFPVVAAPDLVLPRRPIILEADVFRTRPGMLAITPESERRPEAIVRTPHRYRILRAYPGAPPTIPHGFTGDEYRTGTCNTCHEHGGYSPRFNAYVPVTPHPEMVACLQCHVGNDALTGVALPDADPNTVCRQCHPPAGIRPVLSTIDWEPMEWPDLGPRATAGPPPVIPHEQPLRGNCLTCHTGPAALERIRVSHPEWVNCRQCHIALDPEAEPFTRASTVEGDGGGGSS
jgi:hypothetical protein